MGDPEPCAPGGPSGPSGNEPEIAPRVVLTGGAPRELPGDAWLWSVTEGAVEVFVEHQHGRQFLVKVPKDSCFFGLGQVNDAVLAAAGAEGVVLQAIAPEETATEQLIAAADLWIAALGRLFAEQSGQQVDAVAAQPEGRYDAVPDAVLRGGKAPLWAMLPASARARVADAGPILEGPAAIPLAAPLWLRALDEATLETRTSAELAAEGRLVEEVLGFNRHLPALLDDIDRGRTTKDLSQLQAEQAASAKLVGASLESLTRAATASDAELAPTSARLGPVGAALASVLRHLGMERDPSSLASPLAQLADTPTVARQAGVRTRRVLLRPGWPKEDLGALIAAWEESQSVIALVPDRRRGYRLLDPETGQSRPLTPRDEAAIGPTAYTVYRPFPEKPQKAWDLAKFVWRDIRRDGIVAALAGAAVGLLSAVIPIMTAVVIDTVIPSQERLLLVQLGIALGLAALLSFAFSIVREIALHRINGRTESALQAAIWDRLLRLPASFFRGYSAGDLAQRAAGLEAVRDIIIDVALGATLTFVFSSFNLVLLFIYSPPLAGVAVILVLVLALITFGVGIYQIRYGRTTARLDGELAALVFQFLQGVTKLRVAGAESRAFSRWAERYAEERLARIKAGRIQNHFEAFSGAYQIISLAILYGATSWLATDKLSAGFFIAFLAAFGAYQAAFLGFAKSALSLFAVMPQYERGKPILDAELETDSSKADPGRLTGEIEISGLVFGYGKEGPALFDGLNLSIGAGQAVALVGPSGCGKSTLLRVLLGFEMPQSGAVLYDGQELQSLDLSLLRRQIGVVLQTGRVFAGSILENIRGSNDLSLEACERAAEAAGLTNDLAQMPMGLHTPLTEGASTLSGGQRQRILIARALASEPHLLFLDEATSALDNRTQAIVTETLDQLGVTRLIVAHRLSTVRNADKICFIDRGKVAEQGSFDELMAAQGQFAAFASRQLL